MPVDTSTLMNVEVDVNDEKLLETEHPVNVNNESVFCGPNVSSNSVIGNNSNVDSEPI